MKISYQWLKEFVPLDVTPQTLADELTMKAAEVETVAQQGQGIDKVVVGEILDIKPHPQSTKLQLTKVSVGEDILDIVCGARNIRVGQKVPVALLGARLPEMKIEARTIRGQASEGMLCSPAELGMTGGVDGILILDNNAKVGTDIKTLLGMDDAVLDLKVLADRSYLLSHVGVARDVAAIRGQQLLIENYGRPGADAITGSKTANPHAPNVLDPTLCPRYSCVALSNLRIAASPAWLASRLERLGIRPVNNLVDLTNYVMLELGQPLHAFDRTKLSGSKIFVRTAKPAERLACLDGATRELSSETLVIADQQQVLAVAGVIGGAASEINAQTSGALIESANFQPRSVRRTAQRLKLRTEASGRYERGVDYNPDRRRARPPD
ncbi:MAG: phenylalanine--tRNA ligase subunit beta [Candidatus Andersenbacteria bacterium]